MFQMLTRFARPLRMAVGILALLLPASMLAAAPDGGLLVRIAKQSSSFQSAPGSLVFELNGNAARNCTPTISGASVVGSDIELRLNLPSTGCAQHRQFAFTLTADIAALSGRALPRGQVYRLLVRDQNGGLLAFRIFETEPGRTGPVPENGFWWPRESKGSGSAIALGSGVGIEAQGNQLAVNVFGFNAQGSPVWYFGTAHQQGRVASVDLLELQHGEALFGDAGKQPAARPGPRLDIEFESPSQARAWLFEEDTDAGPKLRTFDLARTAFARSADSLAYLAGRWVLVSDAESAPRQFSLLSRGGTSTADARFADADADAELSCAVDPVRRTATLCSLAVAGAVLADFDRIGIDRLVGRGGDGARVQLLRVPQTK